MKQKKIYAVLPCDLMEWTPELEKRMTEKKTILGFKIRAINLVKVVLYK